AHGCNGRADALRMPAATPPCGKVGGNLRIPAHMNAVTTANLVGITGIARRLVMDGALDELSARQALEKATAERKQVALYLREHKLVTAAQMAAANSIEFG